MFRVLTLFFGLFILSYSFARAKDGEVLEGNHINVDGKMLLGRDYERDVTFSIIYGGPSFTYQVNAGSEDSSGFENYSHSNYRKNYADFTGEIEINEYWKVIPEFQSMNSSHGMFDHPDFSEENRSFFEGRLKNEYKPAPARWIFDLYFSGNQNSLIRRSYGKEEEGFSRFGGIMSMDYIWSASNKVGVEVAGEYIDYEENTGSGDDYSVSSDFTGVFRISEFFMLTASPRFLFNKDKTDYLYFRGGLSTIGIKNLSFELNYEYNNIHYDPVLFLANNRYVHMRYDIDPEIIHKTEIKSVFQVTGLNMGTMMLENLKITLYSTYENNDNFHNYNITPGNLLYIEGIPLNFFSAGIDFVTKFDISGHTFGIELEYNRFKYLETGNKRNITFRPNNVLKSELFYENNLFSLLLESDFSGSVFQRSDLDLKKDSSLNGTLSFLFKVSKGMQLYGKVVNLYDDVSLYREGFPEQGRRFLGGIRIAI